jgi:hypothetical protein
MLKRGTFYVDGIQVSPNKCRKTVASATPAQAPVVKAPVIIQNPTPEKSRATATASITASKTDPYYETPDKYALVNTIHTLGNGGQARAVLVHTGSKALVAKFFKKDRYCLREAQILREIHNNLDIKYVAIIPF